MEGEAFTFFDSAGSSPFDSLGNGGGSEQPASHSPASGGFPSFTQTTSAPPGSQKEEKTLEKEEVVQNTADTLFAPAPSEAPSFFDSLSKSPYDQMNQTPSSQHQHTNGFSQQQKPAEAPGSAKAPVVTQPAQVPKEESGDLADLFASSSGSIFDSFLQPPQSSPFGGASSSSWQPQSEGNRHGALHHSFDSPYAPRQEVPTHQHLNRSFDNVHPYATGPAAYHPSHFGQDYRQSPPGSQGHNYQAQPQPQPQPQPHQQPLHRSSPFGSTAPLHQLQGGHLQHQQHQQLSSPLQQPHGYDNNPGFKSPFPPAPTHMGGGYDNGSTPHWQQQQPQQQYQQYPQPGSFGQHQYDRSFQNMSSDQQRNTEMLFKRPHVVATFGFGGKLFVSMPRKKMMFSSFGASPSTEVVDEGVLRVLTLKDILANTPYLRSFTSFPGPLKTNVNKDQVLNYVAYKHATPDSEDPDPEASSLLWGLLKILCTNYGETTEQGDGPSGVVLKAILELLQGENQPWQNRSNQTAPQSTSAPLTGGELEDVLNRIHYCLFIGDRQKACHEAMNAGLWSHAMVLASVIGPAAVQDVQKQFALSSLVEGSPLRTLYLSLCRQPGELFRGSTQAPAPGLLERWRENIAILLANRTCPADNKVIGSLGDSLWSSQMRVGAAHLCYLLADHPFGFLENPNSRLILLGGDHKMQPRTFINPDSLQRTEIYEYSKKLGNAQYTLPQFQVYKFVYATMLADLGLSDLADRYYKEIQTIVKKNLNGYNKVFLNQLELFGDRLTFSCGKGHVRRPSSSSWFNNLLSKIIGEEDQPQQPQQTQPPKPATPVETVPSSASDFLSRREETPQHYSQPPHLQQHAAPSPYFPPSSPYTSPFDSQPQQHHEQPRVGIATAPSPYDRQFGQTPQHSQQQPLQHSMPSTPSTPTHSAVTIETKPISTPTPTPAPAVEESKAESPKPAGSGFWGALRGVAGKITGRSSKEMLLPEKENEYVYSDELKIWYLKGTIPKVEDVTPPPPPTTPGFSAHNGPADPQQSSAGTPMGAPGGGPVTPPVYSRFGGGGAPAGGRRRYLDTFNQNAVFDPSKGPSADPGIFSAPSPNVQMDRFVPFTPSPQFGQPPSTAN